MRLFTVDANILVYSANVDSADCALAKDLVETLRVGAEPWHLGWPTVYEFARVVTHPKILARPWKFVRAWQYVDELIESPAVRLMAETPSHHAVVREIAAELKCPVSGNLVHDLHLAALMEEHGVGTIYTCDSAFKAFPRIRVVNPFR